MSSTKHIYSIFNVEPTGVLEAEVHSKAEARFANHDLGNDVLDFDALRPKDEQLLIDDRHPPLANIQ